MDVTRKSARKWIDSLSLRVQQGLFAAATYLILLAICLLAISPEQYDLSVGDVAPKTITASKDIVDEITTERRRQAAADAVSPVYYKDDTVSDTVLSDMDAVFSELRAVRELGEQIRTSWGEEGGSFTDSDYTQASGLVTRLSLSNYQLRTLMNTTESDFESLYQSLVSATRTTLVSTITEGQINDAINNIQQIVSYNTRTDLWYNVAIPTLRACLKANMLIDQAATEENRQKASDAVEPTVYKQDQNIVVKGDRVTAEQIAVLDSLGLLEGNSFDYPLYIGTAVTLALILVGTYLYAYLFAGSMLKMGSSALVLLIAGVLTVLLCLLMGEYLNVNAMPVALGAMLVVNLLGTRPAYVADLDYHAADGKGDGAGHFADAQRAADLLAGRAGRHLHAAQKHDPRDGRGQRSGRRSGELWHSRLRPRADFERHERRMDGFGVCRRRRGGLRRALRRLAADFGDGV